jgi:hypothetical protein
MIHEYGEELPKLFVKETMCIYRFISGYKQSTTLTGTIKRSKKSLASVSKLKSVKFI